jgi:tetratricopeptide (TPR) repeat protein
MGTSLQAKALRTLLSDLSASRPPVAERRDDVERYEGTARRALEQFLESDAARMLAKTQRTAIDSVVAHDPSLGGNPLQIATAQAERKQATKKKQPEPDRWLEASKALGERASYSQALDLAAYAIALAGRAKPIQRELLCAAQSQAGWMCISLGHNEDAVQHFVLALKQVEAARKKQPVATELEIECLYRLANALSNLDRGAESDQAFRSAIAIGESQGALTETVTGALNYADDLLYQERVEEARPFVKQGKELAERDADQDNKAYALATEARLFLVDGRPADARANLLEAFRTKPADSHWNDSLMHADLALAELALGNQERALFHAGEGVGLATKEFFKGCCQDTLGRVLLARGDLAGARAAFDEAIQIFERSGDMGMARRSRERRDAIPPG